MYESLVILNESRRIETCTTGKPIRLAIFKEFLSNVHLLVSTQMTSLKELLITLLAGKGFLPSVKSVVCGEVDSLGELLPTHWTLK